MMPIRPYSPVRPRFQASLYRHPEMPSTPKEDQQTKEGLQLAVTTMAMTYGGFIASFFTKVDAFMLDSQILWTGALTMGSMAAGMAGYGCFIGGKRGVQALKRWYMAEDRLSKKTDDALLAKELVRAEAIMERGMPTDFNTALKLLQRIDEGFNAILEDPDKHLGTDLQAIKETRILAAKAKGHMAHIMQENKNERFYPREGIQNLYSQAYTLLAEALPVISDVRMHEFRQNDISGWEHANLQDTIESMPEIDQDGYALAINVANNACLLYQQSQIHQVAAGWGDIAVKLSNYLYDEDAPVLKGLRDRQIQLENKIKPD